MLRTALMILGLLLLHVGWARATIETSDYQQQSIDAAQADLSESEQVLRAKDSAQWTQREVQHYLHMALNNVMEALQVYVGARLELPASAQALREEQILSLWPSNPLRDWEPLDWQVYAPDMEFIPGGLIMQCVPKEVCATPVMLDMPDPQLGPSPQEVMIEPRSFILSINGPDPDSTLVSGRTPKLQWGVIPPGSIYYVTHMSYMRKQDYDMIKAARQRQAEERFP